MLAAPILPDDTERLVALRRYCVLDTAPEPAFDRLTRTLQHILRVPTVLVSLVDADRQWFKSRIGLGATETPRNISFCGHAVAAREMLVVADATADTRFADNPMVAGEPHIRFYAGAPLITADGFALGTICAIDYVARAAPDAAETAVMRALADTVVDALELRRRAQMSHLLNQIAAAANEAADMESAVRAILGKICLYAGAAVGHVWFQGQEADEFVSSKIWYLADKQRYAALRRATPETCSAGHDALIALAHDTSQAAAVPDLASLSGARITDARGAGLTSAFAFPVHAEGKVQAVVECYFTQARALDPDLAVIAQYASAQLGRLVERAHLAQVKDEFVSTVSHELRTPLTAIAGSLELVAAGVLGELPAQAKNMIAIAHNNSRRLIRLVNDILDIEKIESGRMPFDLAPQPLAPLIERAIAETASFAESFDIRLVFANQDASLGSLADADRLLQVLTNLLSNAVKFSPKGGVVTVTLGRQHTGLRISVADKGPGIPETFQHRLFQKFAQADGSDSRRIAGTGLGLAIVKNIVERLQGTITFETAASRGTVFHVDLPEWRVADTSCVVRTA